MWIYHNKEMKKKDTKPKSKPKRNIKMKQKQKQNQSVVINISNSSKTTKKSSVSKPSSSYQPTVTTYPLFRESSYQTLQSEPIRQPLQPFIDNSTLRTEVPVVNQFSDSTGFINKTPVANEFINTKTPVGNQFINVKTPKRSLYDYISKGPLPIKMDIDDETRLYDSIPTKRNLGQDFSIFVEPKRTRVSEKPETRLPLRGRPKKILTETEKENRRIDRNKKRANKYAEDKKLKESSY
jgi:hypothetical protein